MESDSNELVRKGRILFAMDKVTKDIDTEKRIYFVVQGESGEHSVIYEKEKKEFKCDCKFNSLHDRKCSHVFACMFKEKML